MIGRFVENNFCRAFGHSRNIALEAYGSVGRAPLPSFMTVRKDTLKDPIFRQQCTEHRVIWRAISNDLALPPSVATYYPDFAPVIWDAMHNLCVVTGRPQAVAGLIKDLKAKCIFREAIAEDSYGKLSFKIGGEDFYSDTLIQQYKKLNDFVEYPKDKDVIRLAEKYAACIPRLVASLQAGKKPELDVYAGYSVQPETLLLNWQAFHPVGEAARALLLELIQEQWVKPGHFAKLAYFQEDLILTAGIDSATYQRLFTAACCQTPQSRACFGGGFVIDAEKLKTHGFSADTAFSVITNFIDHNFAERSNRSAGLAIYNIGDLSHFETLCGMLSPEQWRAIVRLMLEKCGLDFDVRRFVGHLNMRRDVTLTDVLGPYINRQIDDNPLRTKNYIFLQLVNYRTPVGFEEEVLEDLERRAAMALAGLGEDVDAMYEARYVCLPISPMFEVVR